MTEIEKQRVPVGSYPVQKDDSRNLGDVVLESITEGVEDAGVTIEGVTLKDGAVTTTAPPVESVTPAIDSDGTDNTDAVELTTEVNVITAGSSNYAVKLPTAVVGSHVVVANKSGSTARIYPGDSDQIDDKTLTIGYIELADNDVIEFNCFTTVRWQSNSQGDVVYGTFKVDTIAENSNTDGVAIDNVKVRGETNAISLTNGTASVGVAAGKSANINGNLTVSSESTINQDVSSSATPTFAGLQIAAKALSDEDASISASDSGKVHIIADVSVDRTFTLPTPAEGLCYKFVSSIVAADGHDWIFDTGNDTNYFLGGLVFLDSDAASGGDEIVQAAPDGNSESRLQVNLPDVGTEINMYCDGTNWYLWGRVVSATAPAYSDQ